MSNFKNISCKKYFLYRHIRLDKNVPFYIGVGINNRVTTRTRYYERAFNKSGRNNWWHRIVNKYGYEVEIVYETDNESEIREKEKEFISLYGRRDLDKGTLVNLTDGGGGALNVSEETRKKLSEQKIGNKHGANQIYTIERRRAISDRTKGRVSAFKGKNHSEKNKKLMSSLRVGIQFSEVHRHSMMGTKPNEKKIFCVNTGVEYKSIGECIRLMFKCKAVASSSEYRNIKHGISKACNGKRRWYKKHIFKFLN